MTPEQRDKLERVILASEWVLAHATRPDVIEKHRTIVQKVRELLRVK